MLKRFLSILCKILTPEYLYMLPTAFIWFPVTMYGIITHKSWVDFAWVLLLVWFILTLILYPLLMGLAAMLFDKLRKEKHNH